MITPTCQLVWWCIVFSTTYHAIPTKCSESMPPQALDDVLVLDLTHYIAGPYCTKLLADYGARVIKIERPDGGDPCRRLGPFPDDVPHPEKSGLFLHLNTNKESVTLNLKLLRGRQRQLRRQPGQRLRGQL